ncbi:MAG: radical SAM protein [Desulfohalobiaceae bacterium]
MDLDSLTQRIRHVVVDDEVRSTPVTDRVRTALPDAKWHIRGPNELFPLSAQDRDVLYLKRYKGRFLRFCPGTSRYRCCGYRILHIGENCPLSCTYCILRAYFQDSVLKVWANQQELMEELDREIGGHPDRLFRVGTGEFTDSLALEPLTGYSRDLVAFLANYDNCCLELKTKTADLSWMTAVRHPERVLPAWSLNAPEVAAREEEGATGLEERLAAARECARSGFRVCLHFDPVLFYPGWEEGYDTAVDMIFDYLRPRDIAYVSLGSFRCMPELARQLTSCGQRRDFLQQEFVTGLDGKLRLLRPLRARQLRRIASRLRSHGLKEQLYLCMESDEVWRDTLGYTPRDLGGLASHLLRRAFPSGR